MLRLRSIKVYRLSYNISCYNLIRIVLYGQIQISPSPLANNNSHIISKHSHHFAILSFQHFMHKHILPYFQLAYHPCNTDLLSHWYLSRFKTSSKYNRTHRSYSLSVDIQYCHEYELSWIYRLDYCFKYFLFVCGEWNHSQGHLQYHRYDRWYRSDQVLSISKYSIGSSGASWAIELGEENLPLRHQRSRCTFTITTSFYLCLTM